jgi:hypothetical protein
MMWKRLGGLILSFALTSSPALAQDPDEFGSGDGFSFGSAEFGPPNVYVVQKGDTLWEISERFLGNSYYWPRLWSINEQVTNPHWIYPGNQIKFRMGTLTDPPDIGIDAIDDRSPMDSVEIVPTTTACGPNVRFESKRPLRSYLATGFLAQRGDVEIYGEVTKARGIQTYLSARDLLYLKVDDPEAFDCGDVVSVYRKVRKRVKHPTSRGQKYGSLYRIVAEAKVVHRHDEYLSAVIRQSWAEVTRGDLVGPQMPVAIEIEVQAPDGELDGTIVERVEDAADLMGPGETVFIDRGRADGVRVGDSFHVVEQRDPYYDIRKEDDELPFSVIGRIVVVRVDEYSATAIVSDADRSLAVGNKLLQKVE